MGALAELPPAGNVSLDEIFDLACRADRLPDQLDRGEFGQPPVTVFSTPRFYVSVLFWLTGTTAIHDHSFDGAFHVLHGGSLHTTFRWDASEIVSEQMQIGALREERIERLSAGDSRPIRSGGGMIHSLFHLEEPSATVVIRTPRASVARPQYCYWHPGIACCAEYQEAEIKRRVALMHVVYRAQPERFAERCLRWFTSADSVTAFLALRSCLALASPEEADAILTEAEQRRPALAGHVRAVLEELRRETAIIRRRTTVKEPELRFFLAVLLNVRGREAALRTIKERFAERDPVDAVLGWVDALARTPAPGGKEGSALGFELDDVVRAVLRGLLRGETEAELEAAVAALAKRPLTGDERGELGELVTALRGSELFRRVLG
jgi:hypothetical protein